MRRRPRRSRGDTRTQGGTVPERRAPALRGSSPYLRAELELCAPAPLTDYSGTRALYFNAPPGVERLLEGCFDRVKPRRQFERLVGVPAGKVQLALMILDLHLDEFQTVRGRDDDDALGLINLARLD